MLDQPHRYLSDAGRDRLAVLGQVTGPMRWNPPEFWTPEKVARLKELAGAKELSAKQIGIELGCTRNAVVGKCHRLRIELRAPLVHTPRDKKPKPEPQARPPRSLAPFSFVPRQIDQVPLKIGLLDLRPFQCRSIVDGETDDNCLPVHCGHQTGEDSSWCPAHRAIFTYKAR